MRKNPDEDTEGGRGLLLVEALTERWDVYRPDAGGKVTWAEVSLTGPPKPPPLPPLPVRVPGAIEPPSGPVEEMASTALMQRLLDGLRRTN
ncbi:ATP-binding protein [Streptomyces sp. cmx-18-6]|uniref:ATP-binding protein n=1 Tax=Streptomyces sp. cmx-18-6 TaxID=2790930 RepID=UPI0039806AE9